MNSEPIFVSNKDGGETDFNHKEHTVKNGDESQGGNVVGGVWCPSEVSRATWWPGAQKDTLAQTACPTGTRGLAYRRCTESGWQEALLGKCTSQWIEASVTIYQLIGCVDMDNFS